MPAHKLTLQIESFGGPVTMTESLFSDRDPSVMRNLNDAIQKINSQISSNAVMNIEIVKESSRIPEQQAILRPYGARVHT